MEIVGDDVEGEDERWETKGTSWTADQQRYTDEEKIKKSMMRKGTSHDSTLSSERVAPSSSSSSPSSSSSTGTMLSSTSLVALPSSDRVAKFFSVQRSAHDAASVPSVVRAAAGELIIFCLLFIA